MKNNKIQWLSHTAIETINRCPRCFWLSYKEKIPLPEGIQSRLANRFDVVLKNYFNHYRSNGSLPPIIEGKLSGKLQNPFRERYYFQYDEKYGFYGKLDDCLVSEEDKHIPIDFKTASSDPREKEIIEAYQNQIDGYVFLMQENRVDTADFGYLIFFYPDLSNEVHKGFPMIMKIEKVAAQPEQVLDRIIKAIEILEGNIPEHNPDCSYCNWFHQVKKYY